MLVQYHLFLGMNFFIAPDSAEFSLNSMGLFAFFTFDLSVDIILVVFSERSSSKFKTFMTEAALDFLWSYIPPPKLAGVLVSPSF